MGGGGWFTWVITVAAVDVYVGLRTHSENGGKFTHQRRGLLTLDPQSSSSFTHLAAVLTFEFSLSWSLALERDSYSGLTRPQVFLIFRDDPPSC